VNDPLSREDQTPDPRTEELVEANRPLMVESSEMKHRAQSALVLLADALETLRDTDIDFALMLTSESTPHAHRPD
jgi:hypothetical protein